MSRQVIQVENLSKLYRLGEINTGMLSHDLQRFWAKVRGKEDPFMKVEAENDRTKKDGSDYAWALQDINFTINQGDTVGIIGKNGAGKSTLLKILSRVTSPTKGNIKIRGRIASLLEVGTGFHPELTGRENIFLNGAILGMTKKEIASKFDEIVDFSGVARYIDTPVKRYSSGMYVRLAFAVAAHLEPEILIVDEVLAVGDAEFQKKCLGKMSDVASHGRAIIFVSHNMMAVQNLCKSAMFLKSGRVVDYGNTAEVINNYLSKESIGCTKRSWAIADAPGNSDVRLTGAEVVSDMAKEAKITVETPTRLRFEVENFREGLQFNLSLVLYTVSGTCVFNVATQAEALKKGTYSCILDIPANLLNDDIYNVSLYFVKDRSVSMFHLDEVLTFEVHDIIRDSAWHGKWIGAVRPNLSFSMNRQHEYSI